MKNHAYQSTVNLWHPLDGLDVDSVLDVVFGAVWVGGQHRLVEDPLLHGPETHVNLLARCQCGRRNHLQSHTTEKIVIGQVHYYYYSRRPGSSLLSRVRRRT